MLNKKRLKITVGVYLRMIGVHGIVKNIEKYNRIYGKYYIDGFLCAIANYQTETKPYNRKDFQRQRDYERYMNGYNNGKHINRQKSIKTLRSCITVF